MLPNSDVEHDKRIEAIFSSSPLLTTFINGDLRDLDTWQRNMQSRMEPIRESFEEILGPRWQQTTIIPLLITLASMKIFDQSLSFEMQHGIINIVLGIGFQVGDIEACREIVKELCVRLGEVNAIDLKFINKFSAGKVVDAVTGLLGTGVYIRQLQGNDTPDSFMDFIDGLDIQ